MTTTKKLAIAVVALSLALVCAIGGTLAFLVAESDTVTNTFTYGKIEIELWENEVDENGVLDPEAKDYDGIVYEKIVPGDVVNKNPTVTVKAGSEECYVYVKVTNTLVVDSVVTNMSVGEDGDWQLVESADTVALYRYKTIVKDVGDFDIVVFNKRCGGSADEQAGQPWREDMGRIQL